MYCHNCGQYVEDDDVFCNHCGARVLQEPEEPAKKQPAKKQPANSKGVIIALAIVAVLAAGGLAGWGLFRVINKPSVDTEEASAKEEKAKEEKKEEPAEVVEDEMGVDDFEDEIEETLPAEEEQDTQTQVPAFIGHDGDIFPESSDRLLSEGDVRVLTDYELRIAINEIYARNHYLFQTSDMKEYFSKKDWYTGIYPNQEDVRASFNSTEEANMRLMEKERSRR